ncbi:MAG: LysM peptidoglycan-binding domain-containing protein [Ornithinimicrobium sp.]
MSPAPADMPPLSLSAHTAVHGPIAAGPTHHLAKGSSQDYTVRPGDTVYDIAATQGTTAAAIVRTNGLADGGRWIMPGQRLRLGGQSEGASSASTSSASSSSSTRSRSGAKTVTVRPGNTLSGIAAKHGVSVQSLASANNIRNTRLIYPGQRLVIRQGSTPASTSNSSASQRSSSGGAPSKTTRPTTVTVASGDTLSGIAAKYGISLAALQRANPGIEPRRLWVGSTVRLTGSGSTSSGSTSSTPAKSSSAGSSRSSGKRNSPYTPDNIGDRYSGSDVDNTFLHYTYSSAVARSAAANRDYLSGVSVPSRDATKAMIVATARRHGVDPSLMLALSYQESGWNQRAVSPANAIGAMQVIPTSGDWASGLVGRKLNLLDPQDNVTAGTVIMRALLRSTDSESKAIGGYYQGMGSVQQYGLFNDTETYVASIKALRATM